MTLGYGAIGFYDDFLKVTKSTTNGFSGKVRLAARDRHRRHRGRAASCGSATSQLSSALAVPFFKDVLIPLGMLFLPFGVFVVVGAGNAVNLTDGLDGLAIVPVMIAAASFGLIVYLVGNAVFADYLQLHFVKGTGELAVLCGAIVGAALGFLWFNAPPAMIFMGDTGSLSLGGALGAIAVAVKHEIVLGDHRRLVRARDRFGHRAGRLLQADRQARLRHGAAASSFRAEGLAGADHRHPLLDHRLRAGADRPVDAEAAGDGMFPAHTFKGKRVAVFGLARSGTCLHRSA